MTDVTPTPPWVFTPLEVARVLKISREKVYEGIASQEIPAFRIGGQWRIPAGEVAKRCGVEEARAILGARDELRRAQHDIRGVVAMANLDEVLAGQLLSALRRIDDTIKGLTAQEGE